MFRVGKEEADALVRVINSGKLFKTDSVNFEVYNCEDKLKSMMGSKYAFLLTSGKAALISALIGMGVGPGDEVIVPAYTYIATAIAVTAVGAIPVIAEVDSTLTLDAEDVEKKISKYTKVILPVHIQGFPSNMDALLTLAKKYNLMILEDACQSDGGSYKGKRLGTVGNAGTLSFNYYKIISAGEGGALLTDDKTIYGRAFIYHDSSAVAFFGDQLSGIDEPLFTGNEFRISELTGAMLSSQLDKLDGILFDLRKNKKAVMDELKDIAEFAPSNDIEGDCGTTIPFRFKTEAAARKFATAKDVFGILPIDTGKHVYTRWESVLEHRGAVNPNFDPFKMQANKNLNMNYSKDMCPKTLDYLSRTVYVSVNPDWTKEELEGRINILKGALK